jgi:hypothetical protein
MPSHDNIIIMVLGSSSSFTTSVDTSTLGMDHTPSNPPVSSSVKHVDTMVSNVLQENIIEIHEELEKLQNEISTKPISATTISTIDNIHHMIEIEGVDLM